MLYGKYKITAEERESRKQRLEEARANLGLEGISLGKGTDDLRQSFIAGDLTFEEFKALKRAFYEDAASS